MHRYDGRAGIPGDVGLVSDGKDGRIRKERQSDAVVKGRGPEAADANSNIMLNTNTATYSHPAFKDTAFVFVTSCKK